MTSSSDDKMAKLFKGVAWLPMLMIIEMCIGVLTSFLIAYYNNHVTAYLPFISENGAQVPEMCMFSFTLSIGSFIGAVVVWFRYLIVTSHLEKNKINEALNFYVMLLGIVSMAGLTGVAALPVSTLLYAHLVSAGIHFGGSVVYICIQTYLTLKTSGELYSEVMYRTRLVLSVMLVSILILLIILFPVAYFKWIKVYDKPPAMKVPSDQHFWLVFFSSVSEWLLYGIFLSYIFTFTHEFSQYKVRATAHSVSNDTLKPEDIVVP